MRTKLILALFLFLNAHFAHAQMMEPVKWSFEAEKVKKGEYDIVFTANIEKGWYVYSQHLDPGGPIPTSFKFSTSSNLKLLGNALEEGDKKVAYDEMFGIDLVKYSNKVLFTQRVKVKDDSQPVKGYLTFMTCDDESCLPPTNIDFEIFLE